MKNKKEIIIVVVVIAFFTFVSYYRTNHYVNSNLKNWPVVYAKVVSTHDENENCGDTLCSYCYLDLEFEYDNMTNNAAIKNESLNNCKDYVDKYIKVIVNPEKSAWGSYTRVEAYEWKIYNDTKTN